uniref:Uncharacterized protein n=1 Tax=Oryza brachyantha TaxID=4533 RepID=J3LLY8_ORYBR
MALLAATQLVNMIIYDLTYFWLINMETNSWSSVDTYGKVPISRREQSVSLIGSRLIMFGGEDNKRHLLNDLHILDLERMMWEEVKTEKGGPAPRYDHSAAVYADQYLLIFGGSSHSTCFTDLYLLDLQTMWPKLVPKAKDGDADCVKTHVFWNDHEPALDVQGHGGVASLRAWDGVLTNNEPFKVLQELVNFYGAVYGSSSHMKRFTMYIVDMIKKEQFFSSHIRHIILAQVENEYGGME